jgi:hypothetical protein
MMNSEIINLSIIRIDHKNSIDSFNHNSMIAFKENLYSELSELEEIDNKHITLYLQKLCAKYFTHGDPSNICFKRDSWPLSSRICKFLSYSSIQQTIGVLQEIEILDSFSSLKNPIIKDNCLKLSWEVIYNISLVLMRSFTTIRRGNKILKKDEFLKLIQEMTKTSNSEIKNKSFLNSRTSSFYISAPLSFEYDRRSTTASFISRLSNSFQNLTITLTQEEQIVKKNLEGCEKLKEESRISQNFLEILSIFKDVKMLMLPITEVENENNIHFYLLFLLNMDWLFPNLLNIHLDLECSLNKNLIYFYSKNKILNNINSKPLYRIIAQNKQKYELILLLPYFCSLITEGQISSLKLNIPDSYQVELDFLMKNEKIFLHSNFNILDVFDMSVSLSQMDFTFNSLDSGTFKRVLSLIHKNNNLKYLTLNLFPLTQSDEYFSNHNICKLMMNFQKDEVRKLNKAVSFSCKNILRDTIIDETEYLLNLLALNFEKNLEYLTYILNKKADNLKSIKINFDLPTVFFLNDKYLNAFHKFILNIFSLINTNHFEYNSNITSLEISSHNFSFDSRKFPYLNTYFIENYKGGICKNEKIKNFSLNFRFNKISAIKQFIPFHSVETLSLSELDSTTLKCFISFLNKGKNVFSNLISFNVELSRILFETKEKYLIFDLIKCFKKIKNLKEVNFKYYSEFNEEDLQNLSYIIEGDKVEIYKLFLNKSHLSSQSTKNLQKSKTIDYFEFNTKVFTIDFVLKCFSRKLNDKTKNGKILMNINGFLKKRKKKLLEIIYM